MHKDFNHELFCKTIDTCSHNWLITYNNDTDIKNWLSKHTQIEWELQYTMKQSNKACKVGKELFIIK